MGKSAYFHHVSILSGSKGMLHDCEAYYARNFGMHVVKPAGESPEEEYSFLADNAGSGGAPLEIIGEPWEKREHEFHQRHGSGVDHVAFIVEDMIFSRPGLRGAKILLVLMWRLCRPWMRIGTSKRIRGGRSERRSSIMRGF
jgi:catechol 2,3-dioxygenase-like lactoylglutathione lyase family enzyme